MTVAAWLPNHAYTAGTLVNPTVANGHSYISIVGGTSGSSEPAWSGRWPAVADGVANTWAPYSILTPATLRTQMNWTNTPLVDPVTGQYSDTILGNYILDAIASLELATSRYLVNRPGQQWAFTSNGRPQFAIPNLRTASSVTWMGAVQTAGVVGVGSGYQLLPDAMQTGVYTGIQFRPFNVDPRGKWWLSLGGPTTNWFDTGADNPFDPRNYSLGYTFTSVAQDTVIVGDWGWEPLFEPGNVQHAVEVLAAWYGMRPAAILADSVITPAGGIVSYASMPPEVQQFVKSFSSGTQVVSIG